ncbi:MAG: gamma-glutamyl-gamma-aminobutyrate hydrolase family protein [Acidimicrobiia bacterium]|nr:gamma-glutamyl-gamma-aminobutyrate hydrolase family protein [Acidimicrobiia bacterium]
MSRTHGRVVGIIGHVTPVSGDEGVAIDHFMATTAYVKAVQRAGATPVILPIVDPADIERLLDAVDAVVITGGRDVDPGVYGHAPHASLGPTDPERDRADIAIARAVVERDQPTLAVCRGIQILNVALGGTLDQHVDDHMRLDQYNLDAHTVTITPGSRLSSIVGTELLGVNTLHHQVLGELGTNVVAVAHNEHGHVEGIEIDGAPNVLGVQWHPEFLRHRADHLALFAQLVDG